MTALNPASASGNVQLVEPIGIVRAVHAAELVSGGRAIEAEFDADSGGYYAVDVINGDKIQRVIVDARSGIVEARRNRRLETLWRRWSDRAALRTATAGRPLGELLQSVESVTGGRVIDVELASGKGRAFYEVETVTGSATRSLVVDPASGTALIADAD